MGRRKLKCFGDGGGLKRRGNLLARPRTSFSVDCGARTLKPAFRGSGACLRFLSKKGQKAGVHVGTMTQHLSRLPPSGACSPGRPRSSLPNTSFIFRFRAEPPAGARGRGRGAGGRAGLRVANGGRPPPSFPGCRWRPGVDGGLSPGRAPRARGAQRPMPEGGRGNCCGGPRARGRRAPRLPRSQPPGEAARRAPFRAPPAARAVAAAARQAGGGKEAAEPGGGGEGRPARRRPRSRPPPAWTPLARGGLDDERGLRSRLGPSAQLGDPRGHEEASLLGGAAGASSRRPRGRSGPRGSP